MMGQLILIQTIMVKITFKLKSMIMGNKTGFHPKNTGILETGSHEMGHLLERALIEQELNNGNIIFCVTEWRKCNQAKKVLKIAYKNAKNTPEGKGLKNFELSAQVSDYALENASECLAECVADMVANGNDAALLSKEVWKILKQRLG